MPATTRGAAGPTEPPTSLEALHTQLRAAIDKIESGDQWRAWLDFARGLHQYSFNNLILIWTQRPDATAVASYTTWQSVHRQVRRGEKALRIMAPIIRNAVVVDKDGQPVLDSDGKKQVRKQVVGFRAVPVFDVAQTHGPPLPERERPILLTGQAPPGLWDALVSEISERGYRLMHGSQIQLDGSNGLTRFAEREVWVRDDVDDAQAVKTLAHELAHVMLHTPTEPKAAQPTCVGIREIEAESVAHLVMAAHHLDTGLYSFPYVATWAYPLAAVEHVSMADIVTRTGARVMKVASQILAATSAAKTIAPDPAMRALTARVTAAAQQSADLRDQAAAAALPLVDRVVLLGVIADSHDFFRSHVDGSWVADYLAERRLGEAVHTHQLGYAPKQWTTLSDHLRDLGYTDDHIEAAGMATRSRSGDLVDRFRDRLIIPLRDHAGDLVGFTARLGPHHSDRRAVPRYINSPTTGVFRKRELMFGLGEHRARIADGHLPVVCEGPLDAIAIDLLAAETGTALVGVAASGTAFTDQLARKLTDAVGDRPICLTLDADQAGQVAASAVWRKLTDEAPREVVIADLPAGSDPASLFATEREALAHAIHSARPAAWVVAERQIDSACLDGNVLREMTAFRELMSLAERMPGWQRSGYLLRLAERLHIDPADAAVEVAQSNRNLLMEQVPGHCRQLDDVLRAAAAHQREMLASSEFNSEPIVEAAHIALTTR